MKFSARLLASTLAALLAACGKPPQPPPQPQGPPPVDYIVLQPQRLPLTTELPGRTTSAMVAEVRPQVSGLVQARRFTEGSDVKAGQLLYQIDPATYKAKVDSAAAALARAEAQVTTAQLKAARYTELAGIRAVAQQDADDAEATLKQNRADVASARAELQSARIDLERTRITAPISGRIGRSSVTAGALLTANQADALATVTRLDPIYVDVTQPSAALLRLKRDLAAGGLAQGTARVTLHLEDGSTYGATGLLQFSEVTVDQSTGAVTVRATFPNPKGVLMPGMYVRAVVEQGIVEQALLVPQQAVTRDAQGTALVSVIDADSKLQARRIVTDRAVGDRWLVRSGLQAGDKLALQGQDKARPGAQVQARPYQPQQAQAPGASAPGAQAPGASAPAQRPAPQPGETVAGSASQPASTPTPR